VWESSHRTSPAADASRNAAFRDYLEGRALWNTRTGAGLFKSVSYFEQAVKKDPNFPLGYAGLADAYAFDYAYWKQAEAMANKALELDPGLAEPHATLGFIRMLWEWRWADAEGEFRQAIELAPTYATAHQWYALWLTCEGRGQGAKVEIQRSLDLDPSSVP